MYRTHLNGTKFFPRSVTLKYRMFIPDVEYIGTSKLRDTAPTSDDTFLA